VSFEGFITISKNLLSLFQSKSLGSFENNSRYLFAFVDDREGGAGENFRAHGSQESLADRLVA